MNRDSKFAICRVAQGLGVEPVPNDWQGIDPVLHLIERMRKDGAVVLIKFDGERVEARDGGPYTFVVSDGPLGSDCIRADAHSIESGLAQIILRYDEKVWSA